MKKIGSGWTYNVYEYKEGRVLKRKRSFLSRALRIATSDPRKLFKINKTIKNLDIEDRKSFSIVGKLKETNFDFNTLANPVVINSNEYTQDLCTPIYMFFKKNNKMELVINAYINQIKYFWQYGFADTVYNFTVNNGLDPKGSVALIDFNEITDSKDIVRLSIRERRWEKRFSYIFQLNKEQRQYFKNKMTEEITEENLNKFWRKSL